MTWTDEKVEQLKILWKAGYSAGQCSDRMPEFTRNAIIGKVHRLGLELRGSTRPSDIEKSIRQRMRMAAKRRWKKTPMLPSRIDGLQSLRNGGGAFKATPMALPVEHEPPAKLYTLDELENDGCRYFYGHPKETTRGFCGCKKIPGTSWCEQHFRIVAHPAVVARRDAAVEAIRELETA